MLYSTNQPVTRAYQACSPEFSPVQMFLQHAYAEHHHVALDDFLPWHVSWFEANNPGVLLGSVGMASAANGPLFLEQYLHHPIENYASNLTGQSVSRRQIIEVGNLAAHHGFSRQIILSLAKSLRHSSIDWVAFTATKYVLASFSRLGVEPVKLADATAKALSHSSSDWGDYYLTQPTVCLLPVRPGIAYLLKGPQTRAEYLAAKAFDFSPLLLGAE